MYQCKMIVEGTFYCCVHVPVKYNTPSHTTTSHVCHNNSVHKMCVFKYSDWQYVLWIKMNKFKISFDNSECWIFSKKLKSHNYRLGYWRFSITQQNHHFDLFLEKDHDCNIVIITWRWNNPIGNSFDYKFALVPFFRCFSSYKKSF